MSEKYLGSVRFFKHLFLTGFFIIFFIPVGLAFYYWQVSIAAPDAVKTEQNRDSGLMPYEEADQPFSAALHYYQKKYPDLYAAPIRKQFTSKNTIYLTFDDGPSPLTEKVLDVLQKYGVKATFFVVGEQLKLHSGKETLKRIVREGHGIGIHTDSHNYRQIYASVDAFLDDFAKVEKKIFDITGMRANIFRFPGGSINVYNSALYQELISEMTRRGYIYFDWDISSGDIDTHISSTLFFNVTRSAQHLNTAVVLMHDSMYKTETLKALPKIIEYFANRKVQFGTLSHETYPVTFSYRS